MPAAPTGTLPLDAYREEADRFIAALDEEYYLHFAGLKPDFNLREIYERHADLAELETARSLGAAAEDDSRLTELWRFACENYLGNLVRDHEERLARLETELEATVDGETIAYRLLRPALANEPDRGRRERLERARRELMAQHLNPIYVDAIRTVRGAVAELGAPDYAELYRRFGFRLDELAGQCRAFLDATEGLYEEAADRLFRERVGVGLDEARRFDVPRFFRAPEWDPLFPAEGMLPALKATLHGLGIDLDAQPNVHLDLEQRETKSPRAFCSPIEVPGRVVLVLQPSGGVDDWRTLFHEAGHAEHFAHTSPDLLVEERRLGDSALTEGWAMLFEHLTDEPAWLSARLDFPRPEQFHGQATVGLLYMVRRYCAKLVYELELHAADDPTVLAPRYVEILGDALRIEPSAEDYLADVDSSFYVTGYIRSWALEAQLRDHLRERFGYGWFARREAGSLLRELWSLGQKPTADELLEDLTGSAIELGSVADRVRAGLH